DHVAPARVCPHDEREPISLALPSDAGELHEVLVLARRSVVHRVADRGRPDADRILDEGRMRREGEILRRYARLAVELHDQRNGAFELGPVPSREPIVDRDARVAAAPGEIEDIARIAGVGLGVEMPRVVLDELVVRKDERFALLVDELSRAGKLADPESGASKMPEPVARKVAGRH